MSETMKNIITVYIWLPQDFLGHVSMQVGLDTYITFWPNKDLINHSSGETLKSKNLKKLVAEYFIYTTCNSYDEDCFVLGKARLKREADAKVELFNLPEEPIKTFWREFQTNQPSYHLVKRNCASVVAEAIHEGWKAYVSAKTTANNFFRVFENAPEYNDFEALSFTTAAFNLGRLLFWSPKQVWHYAEMVKRLTT
ncbi:MAG: hypothetical protein DSM106950_29100 [Stigonema ocellatum SAG 48.90 = DSM 106950]|nr:hypothetical protein [Stigonema ocellatum SAG 48.90 = DSM 106950]